MFLVIYRILAYGMFYYRGEPPSAATFVVECAGQVAELCHLNFACALTRALRRGVCGCAHHLGMCLNRKGARVRTLSCTSASAVRRLGEMRLLAKCGDSVVLTRAALNLVGGQGDRTKKKSQAAQP